MSNPILKNALITTVKANEDNLARVRRFAPLLSREKAFELGAIVVDNPKPGYFTVILLNDRQQIRTEVTRALHTSSYLITFYVDEPMVFDIYMREAYPLSATPAAASGAATENLTVFSAGQTYQARGVRNSEDDETERALLPDEPIADYTDETGRILLTNPARFVELNTKRPSELASVELAHLVLWEMIQSGASDVYLQAQVRGGRISFLVDDVKEERWTNLKLPIFMDLCRCMISALADEDAGHMRHHNLDGAIKLRAAVGGVEKDFELRMHSHPEAKGVSIVLRSQGSLINDFEKTGMEAFQIENLIRATRLPSGLVLFTGVTGSGKTGTQECVWHYYEQRKTRHLIEITDTLEVISSGRDQIITDETNYTWDDAVRAILRSKPHVVGFGELRGAKETGKAVEASMTGHLVLGTYHAGTVTRTLDRLRHMGVDIQNLADSFNIIQAQVLVNKLCLECREIDIETSQQWGRVVYQAGEGCANCLRDTPMEDFEIGYRGRTVAAEQLVFTEDVKDMIIKSVPLKEIMAFGVAQSLYVPFSITARKKVWDGITSVREVTRKIGTAFDLFYGLENWLETETFQEKNFTSWLESEDSRASLYSRLIKLRELARRGMGGERAAAEQRLQKMLLSNEISLKDIDAYEEKIKTAGSQPLAV